MRRFTSLVAALVALSLAATACGDEKHRVAATVNGQEITVAQVTAFAKSDFVATQLQQSGQGLVSSPPGTQGGTRQRAALDLLVQSALYTDEVRQLGGRVTDADRQGAESRLASNESQSGPVPSDVRPLLIDYLAALDALSRITEIAPPGKVPDDATVEKIAEFISDHPAELSSLTCVDAFAVPADRRAAAQAAVDADQPVDVILSRVDLAAQPLSQDGGQTCVLSGSVAQKELAGLVFEGPIGRWDTLEIPGQTADQGQVVFVRPQSRGMKAARTPAVIAVVNQVASRIEFDKMLREADVTIDSRYGRWNHGKATIVAPDAPSVNTSVPTLGNGAIPTS